MKPMFDDMSPEKFEIAAKAVLVSKKEKDVSLKTRFVKYLQEVFTHKYEFNRNEVEAEILEAWINKQDKSELIL